MVREKFLSVENTGSRFFSLLPVARSRGAFLRREMRFDFGRGFSRMNADKSQAQKPAGRGWNLKKRTRPCHGLPKAGASQRHGWPRITTKDAFLPLALSAFIRRSRIFRVHKTLILPRIPLHRAVAKLLLAIFHNLYYLQYLWLLPPSRRCYNPRPSNVPV